MKSGVKRGLTLAWSVLCPKIVFTAAPSPSLYPLPDPSVVKTSEQRRESSTQRQMPQ